MDVTLGRQREPTLPLGGRGTLLGLSGCESKQIRVNETELICQYTEKRQLMNQAAS
jgi:hypothetical protein